MTITLDQSWSLNKMKCTYNSFILDVLSCLVQKKTSSFNFFFMICVIEGQFNEFLSTFCRQSFLVYGVWYLLGMTCNSLVAERLLVQDNFKVSNKKQVAVFSPPNVRSETHTVSAPARFHFIRGDGLKYDECVIFGVTKS